MVVIAHVAGECGRRERHSGVESGRGDTLSYPFLLFGACIVPFICVVSIHSPGASIINALRSVLWDGKKASLKICRCRASKRSETGFSHSSSCNSSSCF